MLCNKFRGLGPQRRDRLRRIVEIDGEAVRLVAVRHKTEDVVINIAEEMYFGLYSPVVLYVCQRRVFVEEAAVPAAHLVVGFHASVLDVILFENLGGFLE